AAARVVRPHRALVRLHRAEKPAASEVDADHRDARPEIRAERPEHRAVAAEDDDEIRVARVTARLHAVPGGLLRAEDQLDAGGAGDLEEPRDAVADLLLASVRDERRACNGLCAAIRRPRRYGARAHRGRRASRLRSGGRRTPGSLSAPGARSLRPRRHAHATKPPRRRSRAGHGGALRGRGRRPWARRRAPPRTAALRGPPPPPRRAGGTIAG